MAEMAFLQSCLCLEERLAIIVAQMAVRRIKVQTVAV